MEYIVDMDGMGGVEAAPPPGERVVRCRDCAHSTLSFGEVRGMEPPPGRPADVRAARRVLPHGRGVIMSIGEIDGVRFDASAVFGYSKTQRPQERAHAYLADRMVARGYNDTALERVALDLVDRAYEAGRACDDRAALLDEVEESVLAAIAAARMGTGGVEE